MKKHVFPLFFLLASLCGACTKPVRFLNDAAYRAKVEEDFKLKREVLPHGDLFAAFDTASLTLSEREALMFLYAYMPIADVTDYPTSYYLENYRLAERARNEMPWGAAVPEALFRHFVLPVRVNNENLDDARRVFYEELRERVGKLSMKEAILEVNHWCHEKVVYRPSDARTSAPLASVKTAYGRCGEESTFTVAALRSVGIPARQVYTPRWAHTDDNHAWVEAWADGEWYFLGACEPEPVLNLGWFNAPAGRGMLMHTKVFGRYEGPEEVMLRTPNYTEINVIDNYAPTSKASVAVVDAQGNPVNEAKVEFKVYNYAEFYTVATKYTDAQGLASLTAGKGDMMVWASKDGMFGHAVLSFGKENPSVRLTLDKREGHAEAFEADIVPPSESANLPHVTPEQRAENTRRMAEEDSIRHAYEATMMTEETAAKWVEESFGKRPESKSEKEKLVHFLVGSRGNHAVLREFLDTALRDTENKDMLPRAVALLDGLSAKDLRDVTGDVLTDHWRNSLSVSSADLTRRALLNPRVANEMLTPYKLALREALSGAGVKPDAEALITWCKKEIALRPEHAQRIYISPWGVWKARVADERSRDVFFVCAARSLGIPAWIDAVTGKVQYADESSTVRDVRFESETLSGQSETGVLKAVFTPTPTLTDPKYYAHFTLSRFENGTFRLLNYDEESTTWSSLLRNGAKLDTGYYMLVTGTRLASGSVLSHVSFFTIEAGKTTTVDLKMRQSTDQVQVIGNFNSENTYLPAGGTAMTSLLQTCGRGYFVVGVLGVGQEPTNHALRDIAALKDDFEKWGRKLVLLFPSEADYAKFRPSDFPSMPATVVYGIDTDQRIRKEIAEAMKLQGQGALPVFIIADTFNRVVFVSQGYTIGLGEQLMKTIHGL